MKIAVIGTGYVGLVAGACLADIGWKVVCVDKDTRKISLLEKGDMPIYEPGLEEVVRRAVAAGNLSFTTKLPEAVKGAEAVFIGVGTPTEQGTDRADLTYVFAAAEEVARAASGPLLMATKSTVPVGTAAALRQRVADIAPDKAIEIASNPEFLREGAAVQDFMKPDRIVIGVESEGAAAVLKKIYSPLVSQGAALLVTDCVSAEMIKYAANAFLATKIAFINEMADVAEKVGADIAQVARGMGMDRRISPHFLSAGPGFGGSCFPKDTRALAATARDAGAPSRIVETVVESNTIRKEAVVQKILRAMGGSVQGKRIAVLGLTFKANTDDMRESPSLVIIPALMRDGAHIAAFDPEGMEEAKHLLPKGVEYAASAYDAVRDADAVVVLTEWDMFRTLSLKKMRELVRTPLLVDMRNLYDPERVGGEGFDYISAGRPALVGGRMAGKEKPYLSAVKS